ncbi:MAG: MFS transporter [Porticoccaceae bacterium]|nr:MFS transporter [Porticoccaceae bacterium]
MIRPFVENPRIITLGIALLVVWGLAALNTLPRSEDPAIGLRLGTVITHFPGASAGRVEALVTEKLEDKLRELPELKHISSNSRLGLSMINLEVKEEFVEEEVELVWSRARDMIAEASLSFPPGAGEPTLDYLRNQAYTLLLAVESSEPEATDIAVLGRHARDLESAMRNVEGTEQAVRYGAPKEEIEVLVEPHRLSSAGLTMAQLAAALQQADSKTAAGLLENDRTLFTVEVAGELDALNRVREIPVKSDGDGRSLRVGDLAQVRRSERTPRSDEAIIAGQRAVVVAVRMIPGNLRVDQWTARVDDALEAFQGSLPANVKVTRLFSQNGYTQERLGTLLNNVLLGFGLILIVLLLTLGWRSALLVAMALPLTVLFTLGCMQTFGLPIHQMSVTGLVVALGIMVDNAIVMVNTIAREKRYTRSNVAAVLKAVRHLWLPLLGSTLTTILAFMPIALMPGAAGEFVGGIGLSVVFSLIGSYLISHTLIAGLAGRFVHREEVKGPWWQDGIHAPALARLFRNAMLWSIQYPYRTSALVTALPLMGFIAAGQLTEQFFPPADRDMFHVEVFMPTSSSLQATRAATEEIGAVIGRHEGIERLDWYVGRSAPSFYYNMLQEKDGLPSYAQAVVKVRDFHIANRLIPALQIELDNRFPGAQVLVRKLQQGPPFVAPLEFRLYGPNLDRLKTLGNELRRILNGTEGVIHSRSSLANAVPQMALDTSDEALQQVGLTARGLSEQLRNGLDGVVGGSILEANEELPVRVRLPESLRRTPADLESLTVVSPDAASEAAGDTGIPLSALGTVRYKPTISAISRRDGERLNIVEGYIEEGLLPATVAARVTKRIAEAGFTLPAGYRMEGGGEAEKRNDSVGDLTANLGLILTLLVLVIVLSFNSFRMSFVIFTVAIQAAGLGLLSIYLFGFPFGFMGILGLLGLMGLAINAAIVILAELKSDQSAVTGDVPAIVRCVENCSRHISSTTITTVGGFLPLILSGGNFWPPFAIAIAGGTVLTTVVSFFYVPAVFYLFARRRPFESTAAPSAPQTGT